jgi:hypothetical protein
MIGGDLYEDFFIFIYRYTYTYIQGKEGEREVTRTHSSPLCTLTVCNSLTLLLYDLSALLWVLCGLFMRLFVRLFVRLSVDLLSFSIFVSASCCAGERGFGVLVEREDWV